MRKYVLLAVVILSILCVGCGAKGLSGKYTSEDGNYSVDFSSDTECTWYQDDLFFNGTYKAIDDGYQLEIVGDGFYTNTVFTAQKDGKDLIISDVSGESFRFIKE